MLKPWVTRKQLVAARARDRNGYALVRCLGNNLAVDAIDRWLVKGESDLLDSVSDIFTTHNDARVISAEKIGSGLRVIGFVDVLAFGFETD